MGSGDKIQFYDQPPGPSRFIFLYPLYTCGYVTEAMIAEFLGDIERNKPLIIDTSATNRYVPPLDPDDRQKWNDRAFAGYHDKNCKLSARMADLFAFIETHYRLVEVIGSKKWPVYQYVDAP